MTAHCGEFHSAILDPFGCVWTCGSNTLGQLGQEEGEHCSIPKKIGLETVNMVSCGKNYTVCCTENGDVFSFGYNIVGQLGLGDRELRRQPTKIETLREQIAYVACGTTHTICIDFGNSCWGFGSNTFGQLGCKTSGEEQLIPILIGIDQIEKVSCGDNYTFCIKKFIRTVLAFGCNTYGQLGLNDQVHRFTPINIPNLHSVKQISCGSSHTLFLMPGGIVLGCGRNNHGELGGLSASCLVPLEISGLPKIKQICCGNNISLCIDKDESLWMFGSNILNQVFSDESENIQIPKKTSFCGIVSISKGISNHKFINSVHDVWSFGSNTWGQLGNGTLVSKLQKLPEDTAFIWQYSRVRAKSARK